MVITTSTSLKGEDRDYNIMDKLRTSNEMVVIPHFYDPDSDKKRISFDSGNGAYVLDEEDNEYLDFQSQMTCVNAGHGNERIIAAMKNQLDRIQYVASTKDNEMRTRLGKKLVNLAGNSFSSVYFSVSGSEANEAAVQFARATQDAQKILCRYRSYHGATYGTASLTGNPNTRTRIESHAQTSGAVRFFPPRSDIFDNLTPEERTQQAVDHLEAVIKNEDPETIAGLIVEPIRGSSGGHVPPAGYLSKVRGICDEYDILMIADEVLTGFGRCRDWFAVQSEEVQPDLITFGKGVTSAYAPLAGVLVGPKVHNHIEENGIANGQTFAGHPIACAAGVAAIEEYETELLDTVAELEPKIHAKLEILQDEHDAIGDIHGRGFLWGIDIVDPDSSDPFISHGYEKNNETVESLFACIIEQGLLVTSGRPKNRIILAPPFCIGDEEINDAIAALDTALTTTFD